MVRGFVINRFDGDGLHVEGDNTIIVGNYIGLDALGGGAVAGNGAYGIHLLSDFNRVGGTGTGERNVISGNGIDGIAIQGASDNVVLRNYIGTNARVPQRSATPRTASGWTTPSTTRSAEPRPATGT